MATWTLVGWERWTGSGEKTDDILEWAALMFLLFAIYIFALAVIIE